MKLQIPICLAMPSRLILINASPTNGKPLPFSSDFHQPSPPSLKPAFTANFNQHKWNQNISHITSGFWYSSPTAKKARIDEAYNLTLASSLFDYNNVSASGIDNVLWYLTPSIASAPQFYQGYEPMPSFPLFSPDLLVANNGVYAGVTTDPDFGEVVMWNIVYGGKVPATLLIDDEGVVHGFDYWSPHQRTYVITRLFNIVAEEPPADVFSFPKPV